MGGRLNEVGTTGHTEPAHPKVPSPSPPLRCSETHDNKKLSPVCLTGVPIPSPDFAGAE